MISAYLVSSSKITTCIILINAFLSVVHCHARYLKILKNGTQKIKENTKSDDTKIIVLTQTRVCNKVLFSDQKDYPAIDRSVYSNV